MERDPLKPDVGPEPPAFVRAVEYLFHDLEASGALPEGVAAGDAVTAVLCTLTRRLSGGEARDFAESALALRPLIRQCALHRGEHSETFDRETFLHRIADHLGIDPAAAERLARAVFAAARRRMPEKEVDDAADQLPRELRELWLGD